MNFKKIIVLSGLLSSASLYANDLTWPAGENVCAGRWTYTQLASCGYADNLNDPIYGTTNDVSYINGTCLNWDSPAVAETRTESMEWIDSIVAPSPATLKPVEANSNEQWSVIDTKIEGPWNGSCKKRNVFRKCVDHAKVRRITFTFQKKVPTTTQSASCAKVEVLTPRQIVTGYNKLVGYNASCPGATRPQSSYLTSKDAISGPGVDLSNLSCSTLDGTPVTDDASILNKFDSYMNLAFDLTAQADQCPLKQKVTDALKMLADAPGSAGTSVLTEDQLTLVFPTIDALLTGCN